MGLGMSVWKTALFGLALAAAPAFATAQIKPVAPQPDAATLADGLAVTYYFETFNHIDDLLEGMRYLKPHPGEPLATLNYKVGEGHVLSSGSSNFVGAHITGLIRLEAAGTYEFDVTSNDGVRLSLGGETVYEYPEVHSDWTSDPIPVRIEEPGWYAVEVLYFEKKSTSTLILRWKPPGASSFEVVPPAALKHPGS